MSTLYVVTGQTATGKTRYALDLAKDLNAEVISADSRQIYKGMDIVTGKDKEEIERSGIPVHMIDVITPDIPYSSFEFICIARNYIEDAFNAERPVIVVGGTYLYIQHLIEGVSVDVEPNSSLRSELEGISVQELQKKLITISDRQGVQVNLNNSDWQNPRRLIRRIEILSDEKGDTKDSQTLEPLNSIYKDLQIQYVGFRYKDRDRLVKAIADRVESRMSKGAVEEVRSLLKSGYTSKSPGLQTIGYKQLLEYIEGKITLEEAKNQWITKEVRYAKRQYTFMKRSAEIDWKIL